MGKHHSYLKLEEDSGRYGYQEDVHRQEGEISFEKKMGRRGDNNADNVTRKVDP